MVPRCFFLATPKLWPVVPAGPSQLLNAGPPARHTADRLSPPAVPLNVGPRCIWKKSLEPPAPLSNTASNPRCLCSFKPLLSDPGFLMSARLISPCATRAPISSPRCFPFPQPSSAAAVQLVTDDRWLRELLRRQSRSLGVEAIAEFLQSVIFYTLIVHRLIRCKTFCQSSLFCSFTAVTLAAARR